MDFSIVSYTPSHQSLVLDLIEHHLRVHYHLDWHPLQRWLHTAPKPSVLAYRDDGELMGVVLLAALDEQSPYTWVRLFALHDDAPSKIGQMLLETAANNAMRLGIQDILSLSSAPWVEAMLMANRFQLVDHIIHFRRFADAIAESLLSPLGAMLRLCAAKKQDLAKIVMVDNSAFAPFWQMNSYDFQALFPYTKSLVVACYQDEIVAYQLALANESATHLTRLAVHPDFQGQGVATALVQDLIERYGAGGITVNTQMSNYRSQQLYRRLGFERLALRTPVWQRKVFS